MTARNLLRRLAVLGGGAILGGLAGLAHAAPRRGSGWGLPYDASQEGHRIDWLIQITGVFVTLLFIIMVIWMVWACLRHSEKRKHEAEYDHGSSRKSVTVALSLSALIFLVVDGNLFVNSVVDLSEAFWNYEKAENHAKAVRVEVNAHQWAWDFRYPGLDGKFNTRDDVVVLNRLRVPVNRPVILQLAAVDVIHSFSLPNFRVKQDAVPGMVNRLWFQAKETGEYAIACQQHCGINHYLMKGVLEVMPEAQYDAWAEQASEAATRAYDPNDTRAHWGWEWRKL
jgi:cytochrome c oxidase subunit 2